MIKMNSFFHFVSFVFTCIISTIDSQNMTLTAATMRKGPGISSCYYYGALDDVCGLPVVPVSCLPAECTSFILDGLTVDMTHDVIYTDTSTANDEYLDELLQCSGKPVFVCFGHDSYSEWTQMFACSACSEVNSCDEMAGVMAFLSKHPGIAGLLLDGLIPDITETDIISFPGFTESLKVYIQTLKSTFKDLQVGVSLSGWFLVDYYDDPVVEWLDFSVLDSVVDFYEVSEGCLDDCTPDLRNIGISPLNGNSTYTLEKIVRSLQKTKISKDKIYFLHQLNPSSPDPSISGCTTSFAQMCNDPKLSNDWCSPTLKVLYDKGVYSNTFGSGFTARYIDYDDSLGCCGCSLFPSFYAILNGFNCCEPPPPCPKFDRT